MTKVIAHRGSKGTHPENTLLAFEEALACQADGIELDIHLTKDRELVVIHDESIDRTTNGKGLVDSFTLAELQAFDAGSWFGEEFAGTKIPSFAEVLSLLKKHQFAGLLNIEIKTDKKPYIGIEAMVAEVMGGEVWDFEYIYSSFNFETLELMEKLEPDVLKAYITYASKKEIKRGRDAEFIAAIHPKVTWVVSEVSKLEKFPKSLRPWTVNDELQMQLCFRHKLAAIHTDFPREAIRYRNLMEGKA